MVSYVSKEYFPCWLEELIGDSLRRKRIGSYSQETTFLWLSWVVMPDRCERPLLLSIYVKRRSALGDGLPSKSRWCDSGLIILGRILNDRTKYAPRLPTYRETQGIQLSRCLNHVVVACHALFIIVMKLFALPARPKTTGICRPLFLLLPLLKTVAR